MRCGRRYIPVYLLPALLVHRQKLLTGPGAAEIWGKAVAAAARSSLFLSLYCTLAWRGGRPAAGRPPPGTPAHPERDITCPSSSRCNELIQGRSTDANHPEPHFSCSQQPLI